VENVDSEAEDLATGDLGNEDQKAED